MKVKICARCHWKKAAPGRSRCLACARKTRAGDALRRKKRRRLGLCADCGKRAKAGKKFCQKHLDYHAAWNRRRRRESRR
jgi:hypothetical protein